ncbi:MAG: HTH domain-containing protein [Candidatus Beckwithbacteria bacterium GW2011_GWB1_47_15]|uniref:HTH domain-containing protein n=1 Tax=Candidatus Beckwithbacteria bacterium GW2011_GWB1_47_15 TaxID=1618371 RepID=A0A0G1RX50_9BACT|nr:MAG: hypothetical protein UY43_C0001G0639 [Candidatus Beckwithbacteria bacterium GW2011_GWC1_49_16]KKU35617.1 MAG: HTH domain-containing protein [Candidatus Beckwithbacteria bacterium GW2011_GWA1_46_30]KKU61671.1 MAG: HTH domain-containing protein [Candidatus Beckwithbacteria bacterium GW2011_GWB1_47_15]KKU72174.1 MAG: HTH domain-containing protein [Candidatus Beckwithbacteria bacterium GW2011_GWA2_47_25]KKW04799.1 MAG: HTH domain-containing protein [Candidatus Beckwithbacteria bacterium GW2
MKVKNITLDELLKKQLKDPEFRRLWEESEPQYQATRALIKARLEKKLSQRQLAKKADTTQAVISRVESMAVNPSVGLLQKLASALGKKLEIKFV